MSSLRRQLTLSLLGGSAVLLGAAGWLLYWAVSSTLSIEFDHALQARADALAALLEADEGRIEFEYSDDAMPAYAGGPDPEGFMLWFADGSEATRSASLDGAPALERRLGSRDQPEIWDLVLADGRAGRALGLDVPVYPDEMPDELDPATLEHVGIVVTRSREPLDARLANVRDGLFVAALVALLLVAWGVTFSVRRGLAPVRRLGAEVSALDAASLGSRRLGQDLPEELLPFATRLDELFDRLQASFEKQRRMTAAMAHELRTPIAELRSASDVVERWPDDAEVHGDLRETARDVALRMGGAVDAVMKYCRLESGEERALPEAVTLAPLVAALWAPHEKQAAARGLVFRNAIPPDASVDTDRELLALVLGNLLHNAASFASEGELLVDAAVQGGVTVLRVSNATDDLRAEDLEHLAEPFWRKDSARSSGQHSGLGLALVSSISEVLGRPARFTLEGGRFVVALGLEPADEALPARNGHRGHG